MTPVHDAVIVGAGLAGLTAARELQRSGAEVVLIEAADAAGGRIRTDRIDGVLLDRGFQLLNPAYPCAARDLDLAALDLCPFEPGAIIARGRRSHLVADPRRAPRDLLRTATLPLGTLRAKFALIRWAAEIGYGPASRIKRRTDGPFVDELRRRGLDGDLVESLLRPFLAGVLADDELVTSRRLAELLVRSFVRGTPGVPRQGMQAIPDQIAADLGPGTLRCGVRALALTGAGIDTDAGPIGARAVVIATGARAAAELVPLPHPIMRSLTTFYHLAPTSPARRTMLHLDGDRRGPVVNTAVVTDAAPGYAPGRSLIASTVLGADGAAEMRRRVRDQLAIIYRTTTASWEHVATYPIRDALPDTPPGTPLRRPVALGDGLFVAGDHRDTASIQGALVSGHRTAAAVRHHLGISRAASA